ncbi:NAD(P)-binding domain-containing protein [Cognatishimia sp. SS12]|uniref:flavin-containing monooxygenase n=1 Tax=Cognatishimia sp. SS12 TaxID=2979465 RepID=UPI00232DEF54|nr:NAD(P)-binding domain-containing protein [Cognatishimia sp. SS12]MDC0738919.1 NAD(P)-binding domain-containing protein [Cognatishimia sp. SS12]
MSSTSVAIIGAGPGGLAAARWLKQHGFDPVLFESHSGLGGQWNNTNPNSGVWPDMRTNTFSGATRFSDLAYPEGTPLFPHNKQVLTYLTTFAERFGLTEAIRFSTEVVELKSSAGGYTLVTRSGGVQETHEFARVVVATGRFNAPVIPPVPGQEQFSGDMGIVHTFNYDDPDLYRGKRVVVAGGSISALEIASDLAMLGAKTVYLAQRRQRYVVPKMVAGTPFEYFSHTYQAALAAETASPEAQKEAQQEFVLKLAGNPAHYGAPAPHPDVTKAGFTASPHYLNLVAEGRIHPVGWFQDIEGTHVRFEDGAEADVDALIFGTGFDLNLPFLSDEIAATLKQDALGMDLHEFTFHPDLPGLGFIGLWCQLGSYFCPIEQQARYLAYAWSGAIEPPTAETLKQGVARGLQEQHRTATLKQNAMAVRFARLNGSDPASQLDSDLVDMVSPSATTGLLFRLAGPDALPDGLEQLQNQMSTYASALLGPST